VMALPITDPRVHAEPLYDEDFVLAVPADHPWADATDIKPSQLRDQELLFLEEGHCLREQAVAVCLSSGVAHAGETTARAASLSTIVQLVSAGLGMTFLPDSAVRVETRGAHLGVARFADPAPGRRIVLVHRRTSTRSEEFEDLAEILRRAVVEAMPSVRRAA
jgi:LysR family transcriptional regulator, hydrogen peroxide-inducible genes activator